MLTALEGATDTTLEDAVRGSLERMDRGSTRDVAARLAHLLRTEYRIDPDAPDHLRSTDTVHHIAGLLEPASDLGDTDFGQAQKDRELAMQLRAELVVDRAIADKKPWLEALGEQLPRAETEWRRRAVIVACFRDLYGIGTDEPLGREHAHARNRECDRQIAGAALRITPAAIIKDNHAPAQQSPDMLPSTPVLGY